MALTSRLGVTQSTLVGSTMAAGVTGDPLNQSLSHSLGLLSFTGGVRKPSSTLFISHSAVGQQIIGDFQSVVHSLGLTQEVDPGTVQDIQQNLGITQQVVVINFGPIEQDLSMAHAAVFAGPRPFSPSNSMSLSHIVTIEFDVPVSVSQSLGLTHQAADVQKHELNITHSVFGYLNASPFFQQDVGIEHTVQITAAYNISLTHTDVVNQSVTFWIDDGTSCPRNDFQNWGTLGEEPFTQVDAKMLFSSLDGTDDIIVLRNPELDDRDRLGQTRINRESAGGELQVYRDPSWPLVNTLQGTIIGLKKEDVDDLLQFFEDHLGEEISLNDWHGRYWRGIITNPDEPAVEDTRGRWTVAFEFEGVEMPGPDVLHGVGITHSIQVIQELTRSLSHGLGLSHEGRYGMEIPTSATSGGAGQFDQEVSHVVE